MAAPALFISHGSPMLALEDCPARAFLSHLAATLATPSAILVASAHWETEAPQLGAAMVNPTIHDFYGFPRPLYGLRYNPPGNPALAQRAAGLLAEAGMPATLEPRMGLDHGAWVPLLLAWPRADIPVLQVSLQPWQGTHHHYAMGRALAPLRQEAVLIIGSGSFTHDLRRLDRRGIAAPEPPDVTAFSDWMHDAILQGRTEDLLEYRSRAPFAARQHPTEEHLLPLHLALGAGGAARCLHRSTTYGALRMDAYAID